MRRRTTRMTQEDLTASALAQAHPFQKVALMELLAKRFRVNLVSYHPRTRDRMIVVRHEGDPKVGFAVYPNGAAVRQNGTIKWDWKRVEDSAGATIPDPWIADKVA